MSNEQQADAAGEWLPAAQVEEFNPEHFDIYWNADYTLFRPAKLRWTDDASYARYQAGVEADDEIGD